MSCVGLGTSTLEQLLAALKTGRLQAPLTRAGLAASGLGGLVEAAPALIALPAEALVPLLEAVLAERASRIESIAELVWTGPDTATSLARDTAVIVEDMFRSAQRSVLIAGYSFDHGRDILKPLSDAMCTRNVTTTIFLDLDGRVPTRDAHAFAKQKIDRFFRENWPFEGPRPTVYYDPRSASPAGRASASMHAKCIVVDDTQALVTSANFTDRGQTRNIEVGVLVRDPSFARSLSSQWLGLVQANVLKGV